MKNYYMDPCQAWVRFSKKKYLFIFWRIYLFIYI